MSVLMQGNAVAKKRTRKKRTEILTPELLESHAMELEKIAIKMRSRANKIRKSELDSVEVDGQGYRARGMGLIDQYMTAVAVAFARAGITLGETTP